MDDTAKGCIRPCKTRYVYGTDLVVTFVGKQDKVTVQEITEGASGRFTFSSLMETLGHFNTKEEVLIFIKNKKRPSWCIAVGKQSHWFGCKFGRHIHSIPSITA